MREERKIGFLVQYIKHPESHTHTHTHTHTTKYWEKTALIQIYETKWRHQSEGGAESIKIFS
jgi:hypothetical protein